MKKRIENAIESINMFRWEMYKEFEYEMPIWAVIIGAIMAFPGAVFIGGVSILYTKIRSIEHIKDLVKK